MLGLTVWAIYLLDRLLDVRSPAPGRESTRHKFYREHQTGAWILLGCVFTADCISTVLWLRPAVLHAGVVLSACVIAYLLGFHFARGLRVAKEVAVALLFTVGTMLVAATWEGSRLIAGAGTFAALCLGNLVAIEYWEFQELRGAVVDAPSRSTIWLGRWYLAWVPLLCLGAALAGSRWFIAVSLSAGLLSLVFASGTWLSLDKRRVLVDAALLTPLLFLR